MAPKVGQFMTRPVLATTPRARIRDIATHLVEAGISGVPVADREGSILGVLTQYDILGAVLEGQDLDRLTAGDLMDRDTVSLEVTADLREALEVFRNRRIHRVPVTQRGRLVGVLSRGDALRAIVENPEFLVF